MSPKALLRRVAVDTALFAVLMAVVAHLSFAVGPRFDCTQAGRYGLSDQGQAVMGRLERPLRARVMWSQGLRAPYHGHREALLDLLDGLSRASSGQLTVTVVDPRDDPVLVEEAKALGIAAVPYTERTADQTTVRAVYLGVALSYGARQAVLPVLPSVERMEEQLVTAIASLVTPAEDRRVVGWWLGHGEPDPTTAPEGSPLRGLWQELAARGAVRTVAPYDTPFPDDLDALVIAAPRTAVHPADVVHLDQFVQRGGRVLAFLSSFRPEFESGRPVAVDHGLYAYFGAIGLTLGRDLVIDRNHHERLMVPLGAQGSLVQVRHPLALVTQALEPGESAVVGLERLVLPFASSLTPVQPPPDRVDVSVWARTETTATSLRGLVTLDPAALAGRLSSEKDGPFPVVVALSGRIPSAFGAGPLPTRRDPAAVPFDRSTFVASPSPSRIVVVGSADAVANNPAFVPNALDWLLEDESLIGLRSRMVPEPSLPILTRGRRIRVELALVGVPLLVLAAGLVLSLRRRR